MKKCRDKRLLSEDWYGEGREWVWRVQKRMCFLMSSFRSGLVVAMEAV